MIKTLPKKRIKIIYIAGAGRSGSTLLNRLLDLHSCTFGVGEIFHLDDYFKHNDPCSCGQPVRECKVWSRIFEKGIEPANIADPYRGKYSKFKRFYNLIGFLLLRKLKPFYQKYSLENKRLFEALLLDLPKNSIIVDSSKNFSRLLMLERSGLFEIMMIHLVRDGRAVLFSHKRPVRAKVIRSRKIILGRRSKRSIEHVFRWMWLNILYSVVIRLFFQRRYKLIRYEDLCAAPEKTINKIYSFVDLEPISDIQQILPGPTSHLIGGNQMRFTELNTIQLDTEYKTNLKFQDKLCFATIAGWINRMYGYEVFFN